MGVGAIDVVAVDVVDTTDVPVVDVAALGRTRRLTRRQRGLAVDCKSLLLCHLK